MDVRKYIIESFGGVHYVWKKKLKLNRIAYAEMEGDTFYTDLDAVSAKTKQEFTHIVPELSGEEFWFVKFYSPTGFKFGMDDKSKKAIQLLINQLKDTSRETNPNGFIFKIDSQSEWSLKKLYDWILVSTMRTVLGYSLYKKKQIAYNIYYIFRR